MKDKKKRKDEKGEVAPISRDANVCIVGVETTLAEMRELKRKHDLEQEREGGG